MQRREFPRYAARTVALRQGLHAACSARHALWVFALFSLLLSASGNAWAKERPREAQLPPEMEAKANAVCGRTDVFDCYTNHKYGYLLAWPRKLLTAQGESDAGDGQVFTAPDGRAQLTCWAGFNSVSQQPLKAAFVKAQQEPGLQVTYKHLGKDFFVVSGVKEGKILYRKTIMTALVQAAFVLTYDASLKSTFDPLVGDIAKSFIAHAAFL